MYRIYCHVLIISNNTAEELLVLRLCLLAPLEFYFFLTQTSPILPDLPEELLLRIGWACACKHWYVCRCRWRAEVAIRHNVIRVRAEEDIADLEWGEIGDVLERDVEGFLDELVTDRCEWYWFAESKPPWRRTV